MPNVVGQPGGTGPYPLPGLPAPYLIPQQPLQLLASTGLAGFPLVNGTPTILSWTAPADGQLHRAIIPVYLSVATLEVGGAIQLQFTDPNGTAQFQTAIAAAQAVGAHGSGNVFTQGVYVNPGSAVKLVQSSALTSGASTLWAEIWGS